MATTVITSAPGAATGLVPAVIGTVPLSTSEESLTLVTGDAGRTKVQLVSDVAWYWHHLTGQTTGVMCPVQSGQVFEIDLVTATTTLFLRLAGGTGTLRVVKVI